jgi:hypothetical protein
MYHHYGKKFGLAKECDRLGGSSHRSPLAIDTESLIRIDLHTLHDKSGCESASAGIRTTDSERIGDL